jgi:hypothetical protein
MKPPLPRTMAGGELTFQGAPDPPGQLGARAGLLVRSPALWVGTIVCVSTLVRTVISLGIRTPWILPDESVYSELAKSIAGGGRPAVRGVQAFGWGEIYPALIAPAWALFHDPVWAYHATLVTNALVMSSAAIPAYFLARMFVTCQSSALVAITTVLVPSMAYTGAVMTENAFYPVFLFAVLLIARSVRRPTVGSQALALAGLGLVTVTRIQGMALVGGYVGAIALYAFTGPRSQRGAYLRRFVPSICVASVVSLAPAAISSAAGHGTFGWLGARSGTFATLVPNEIPKWFVYLVADLVLYVAVIPAAATVVMIAAGLARDASDSERLFTAVVLPTLAVMVASVAVVSASLDVDGTENLNERYVFYVVPLLFLGLASWIERRLPRPRRWTWCVVVLGCVLVALLPVDQLAYNASFQSVALLPWIGLSAGGPTLVLALGGVALAYGILWATTPADRAWRLWVVTWTALAAVGVLVVGSNRVTSDRLATSFEGRATWVDNATHGVQTVVVLDERRLPSGFRDPLDYPLMATEFFNESVGDVYRIGKPTYYEAFLPTIPARARADGTLTDAFGRVLTAAYALVTCRAEVRGRVVATANDLRVIRVRGPLRLGPRTSSGGC